MAARFSVILLSLFLFSCVSSNNQGKDRKPPKGSNSILTEVLGESFQSLENENGQYVLAWTESTKDKMTVTKYAVYDQNGQEIIYKASVLNGYVKWLTPTKLIVKDTPGINNENNPTNTYEIDLLRNTKKPYTPQNEN